MDGIELEFESLSDEALLTLIARAETDLRLSRSDPDRTRRIRATLDAALAERWRRLNAKIANAS